MIEYSLFFFSLTIKDKKHYVLKWPNSFANGQLCKARNVIEQGSRSLYDFSALNRIVYKYFNSLTLPMRQNECNQEVFNWRTDGKESEGQTSHALVSSSA